MTTSSGDLTEVARMVGREAAELVLAEHVAMRQGGRVAVDTKTTDTDVVTAVDTASERLIRRRIAELRPNDAVLGEEEGQSGAARNSVTWVVDPIDGTVNFLYGLPAFAVSVAAEVAGEAVAAAVVEPVSGRCWSATLGKGAWLDDRPLRVGAPQRLETTLLATGFAYDAARRRRQAAWVGQVLGEVRDIRRCGAASLDLCAVAAGWVDGYCEHGLGRWDWAAGALIAAEAGAAVSLPGQADDLGADAVFAAAPTIAAELRRLLAECGAGEV